MLESPLVCHKNFSIEISTIVEERNSHKKLNFSFERHKTTMLNRNANSPPANSVPPSVDFGAIIRLLQSYNGLNDEEVGRSLLALVSPSLVDTVRGDDLRQIHRITIIWLEYAVLASAAENDEEARPSIAQARPPPAAT